MWFAIINASANLHAARGGRAHACSLSHSSPPSAPGFGLEDAFAKFDTDGSKTLNAKEVVAILTRPGGGNPMTEAQALRFIREHDKNGDDELNYAEFAEAISEGMMASLRKKR